ncbi:MAG TPA: helix-hairpin-helix domain-containing protein [Gemmatimonadaceae bacterium]
MPTPAERQALVFFAAVAALGIGVNAWRAVRGGDAIIAGSPGDLATQIARVDSAVASSPSRERRLNASAKSARMRANSQSASPATRQPPATSYQPPTAYGLPPTAIGPIDLDFASVAAVESLPRIGPALAKRIVANRDSFGAFGSLDGLQRVRGIGPGIAKALGSLVTFSGVPRPDAPSLAVKGRRRRSAP